LILIEDRIEIEAKKFSNHLGFTCVSIVGGHSIEEQAYNMREVSIIPMIFKTETKKLF